MKRHFGPSLFAAGVLLLGASGYAQTPITSLPFTISAPGKYVLQQDLSEKFAPVAITVAASNVTIDLGGFTLSSDVRNQVAGIRASGVNNLVIQNGTINNFRAGSIIISSGSGHLLTNLGVYNFGTAGITLQNCTNSKISYCEVSKDSGTTPSNGSFGIGLFGCKGVQVINNEVSSTRGSTFSDAVGTGISSDGTNYFADDYISTCFTGIFMSPTDKYRTITTTDCHIDIVGGIDVDDKSD